MQTAVTTALGKYATFSGRAALPEYWWWVLLSLIPILGSLVLLYFLVQPSTEGNNRFGRLGHDR